jgi:hypothetical protein
VQVDVGTADDRADLCAPVGAEQILEDGGGVGDDDPQDASRDARSLRISSAAGTPRFTAGLASILSKTSLAGGLATSRSSSAWM